MNSIGKASQRKNTKISFRTDEATLSRLKSVCRIENRTISSLIESVLTDHVLRLENPMPLYDEKRQSPRKECTIPAIILFFNHHEKFSCIGHITSISLQSIQLYIKNIFKDNSFNDKFLIFFKLPIDENLILTHCSIVRTSFLHDECVMVAKFLNMSIDETTYISKFLTTHKKLMA